MKKNLTSQSAISTKYQTVIPASIREYLGVTPGETLIWHVVQTNNRPWIVLTSKPHKWSKSLSGLGKEVWKGIDTGSYLKQLRSEWQKN